MFQLNFNRKTRPITPAPEYTPPTGLPGFRPAPQNVVQAGRGQEWDIKEQQRLQKSAMADRFRNSVRADRGGLGNLPSPLYAATMMRATAGLPGAMEQAKAFHPGLSENTLAMKSAMKTGLPYVDEARYLNPEMADAYTRSTQVLPDIQLQQEKMRQETAGIGADTAQQQMMTGQMQQDMEQARQLKAAEEQRTGQLHPLDIESKELQNQMTKQKIEQSVGNPSEREILYMQQYQTASESGDINAARYWFSAAQQERSRLPQQQPQGEGLPPYIGQGQAIPESPIGGVTDEDRSQAISNLAFYLGDDTGMNPGVLSDVNSDMFNPNNISVEYLAGFVDTVRKALESARSPQELANIKTDLRNKTTELRMKYNPDLLSRVGTGILKYGTGLPQVAIRAGDMFGGKQNLIAAKQYISELEELLR